MILVWGKLVLSSGNFWNDFDLSLYVTIHILRFTDNAFSSTFISTIGIDFKVKTILINGKKIKLQVLVVVVPSMLCCNVVLLDMGHCWTGEIPHHHYLLLQTGHGWVHNTTQLQLTTSTHPWLWHNCRWGWHDYCFGNTPPPIINKTKHHTPLCLSS